MKYDYCDCVIALCRCAALGVVSDDTDDIKSLADSLVKNEEDYRYLCTLYGN